MKKNEDKKRDKELVEARAEYRERMRTTKQFSWFGITPEWFPGIGDIEGFCHDEVVRQYHDTRVREEGGVRIEWMLAAWAYAQRAAATHLPTMQDVLAIGTLVEPEINRTTGFRGANVYIGSGTGAPPDLINPMVTALLTTTHRVRPVQGRRAAHPDAYRALWKFGTSTRLILEEFTRMLTSIDTADDWYLAYEAIHPWGDGNGRSGKVLHNWLLGTLADPVLVVDYFGGGNP